MKRIWIWCTAERVQALGTAVIALVTVWTLFFTPLGERLVSEINQTVRETQEEVEHHRTIATNVTLRALSAVETCRGIEIAAERRRGGVQRNTFEFEPTECWLEEACRAG